MQFWLPIVSVELSCRNSLLSLVYLFVLQGMAHDTVLSTKQKAVSKYNFYFTLKLLASRLITSFFLKKDENSLFRLVKNVSV